MFRHLICFAFIVVSRARNVLNRDGFNKKKKKTKVWNARPIYAYKNSFSEDENRFDYGFSIKRS